MYIVPFGVALFFTEFCLAIVHSFSAAVCVHGDKSLVTTNLYSPHTFTMHFTTLAFAAGLGLAAAHGADSGDRLPVPQIMTGRRAMQDFTAARRQIQRRAAEAEPAPAVSKLEARQSVGRCGPDYDNQVCDDGYCCSSAG